jgi:hypothetical protein
VVALRLYAVFQRANGIREAAKRQQGWELPRERRQSSNDVDERRRSSPPGGAVLEPEAK